MECGNNNSSNYKNEGTDTHIAPNTCACVMALCTYVRVCFLFLIPVYLALHCGRHISQGRGPIHSHRSSSDLHHLRVVSGQNKPEQTTTQ